MTPEQIDTLWLAAFKESMSEGSNTRQLFARMVAERERHEIIQLADSAGYVAVLDIMEKEE